MAKANIDFSNVKDGGGAFNKKRQPEGDYLGKVTKCETVAKKGDDSKKMWLFTIQVGSGTYPYYCSITDENQFWKLRNLWVAAGVAVPKKKVTLDSDKILGKTVGVMLEDDEYKGKVQSVVNNIIPPSDVTSPAPDSDEDDEDIDEPDEDEAEDGEEDEDELDIEEL